MKTNSPGSLPGLFWPHGGEWPCTQMAIEHQLSFLFIWGELGRLTMAETKANTVKQLLCDAANPRSQHDSLTAWWLLKAALLSLNGTSLSHCWGFEQILSSCSAYFSNWHVGIFDPFNCHKTCLKYPWWNLTLERQYICKRVRNVLYIPHEH